MANAKDIAKVFYKLAWMEDTTNVLQEFLFLMADDYKSIAKDRGADHEARTRWASIAKQAKDLAKLVSQ